MSIEFMAEEISEVIEEVRQQCAFDDLEIKDFDPEHWYQLFGERLVPELKKYKPSGTPEETEAFRTLYAETKKAMDQGLIPSDLWEALQVLKGPVTDLLKEIAKKNKTVGAEILNDLNTVYIKDEGFRDTAKSIAKKIEKILAVPTERAAAFNIAATNTDQSLFAGKTIVFTGTLSTMTRKQAADVATILGAKVTDAVSRNTDLLVAGVDAGSKLTKAGQLGVTVLTEEQWNSMIGYTPEKKPERTIKPAL